MNMYDIILKKRNGGVLSDDEINQFISGVVDGSIPDYQISALLMAIYFSGMTFDETSTFTGAIARSGDMLDLSGIDGIKADKHSTGGVGDKTSLVIGPMLAACGIVVAKMSGRGLGHTGGTIDKLESIPGFRTDLSGEDFLNIVRKTGVSIVGQSGNLAPADKKLYALRDVTATVDSLPLIASSIMSKKLAAGDDIILLDVKYGSGAFAKTIESAIDLAVLMATIGKSAGRNTGALITNMDIPLGYTVGNSLEVIEAIDTLKGKGPNDLYELCIAIVQRILYMAGKGDLEHCLHMANDSISSGAALEKLKQMVKAQGGDVSCIDDTSKFPVSKIKHAIYAEKDGYIKRINSEMIGRAGVEAGAGRHKKDEPIDHSAGIILKKKTGDHVNSGECIAELHTNIELAVDKASNMILSAFEYSDSMPSIDPLIYGYADADGLHN